LSRSAYWARKGNWCGAIYVEETYRLSARG
jgi:hypothetical protein